MIRLVHQPWVVVLQVSLASFPWTLATQVHMKGYWRMGEDCTNGTVFMVVKPPQLPQYKLHANMVQSVVGTSNFRSTCTCAHRHQPRRPHHGGPSCPTDTTCSAEAEPWPASATISQPAGGFDGGGAKGATRPPQRRPAIPPGAPQ